MGNGVSGCFTSSSVEPTRRLRRRHVTAAVTSEPLDEGLGHSFCYVATATDDSKKQQQPNLGYSISGASVSANPSTALSTALDPDAYTTPAAFESSNRFSSIPLQPAPRFSGPLSGPIDRSGFLSGPIERGFLSGPIDRPALFSGPLDSHNHYSNPNPNPNPNHRRRKLRRSLSQSLRTLSAAIKRTVGVHGARGLKELNSAENSSGFISVDQVLDKDGSLQWAQGKAGEDRVHVVVSEEHGWVFVGIYDGFNGPDATDYLLTNLYPEVQKEVEKLDFDDSDHAEVLKALSKALAKTEETFMDCADMMASENPELALMGSCVLVMLMKGENVYLMNVGDSRAVLATKGSRDLRRSNEFEMDELLDLAALQLTMDHCTSVEEEVVRIRNEHPDDSLAIANDRVKGSLKVTRAFGAGFLKQPKWNNALLEMFRIDYIGTSPYITCNPSLFHHRLGTGDRFLLLSSDGLYQYFTNEEAVAEVELFISTTPDGDPAQHLLEELLFRAAKKAGMDFYELLEIPQGDRRRYHDDVSLIVISLEGRIWRSCV